MEKIINIIGKKAASTYRIASETTAKLTKQLKLKAQMADNKSKIKSIYEEIGKKMYENYVVKHGQIPADIEQDCIKIDEIADEVENIRMQILKLNDLKQCPKCNYEIELDFTYCPNCGEKQELEEEAKQNDGPATILTTDDNDSVLKKEKNKNDLYEIKKQDDDMN